MWLKLHQIINIWNPLLILLIFINYVLPPLKISEIRPSVIDWVLLVLLPVAGIKWAESSLNQGTAIIVIIWKLSLFHLTHPITTPLPAWPLLTLQDLAHWEYFLTLSWRGRGKVSSQIINSYFYEVPIRRAMGNHARKAFIILNYYMLKEQHKVISKSYFRAV